MRFKFVVLFLAIFLLLGGAVAYPFFWVKVKASNLESKDAIMNRQNTGVILLDRNGQVFYKFYEARRISPTPLNDVPLTIRQAVLSAEDKDFYEHKGYSLRAIAASFIANLREGKKAYGGSTITQQLVKNSIVGTKKDYQRKFEELLLARELEKRYSKDEILEMYVNSVYFGEGAFGVEDAARTYFSKPLKEVTIAEAALLAGILNAPSELSPISGNKEKAVRRQHEILQRMREDGFITATELAQAKQEELLLKPQAADTVPYAAPHYAFMVRQELIDRFGEEEIARSGYIVQTALDPEWQGKTEEAVRTQVAALSKQKVSNGAAVVMDPKNGQLKAVVGSIDWNNPAFGKVNVAASLRQPGSSFKPIVYLAGLEKQDITTSTILKDVPTTFGKDYKPKNYDGRYRGNVTVRRALASSLNIPTVEVQQKIGVPATIDLAGRLGLSTITSAAKNDLSISLGSKETKLYEMVGAYATIANGGRHNKPTTILSIKDKFNEEVYTHAPENKQAVDARYAYLLTSILSDNNARKEVFGTSLSLDKNRLAAVKTGTSQSYRDSWTVGFTPSLAIGVWVGNNDGSPMDEVAGSLGAAPIWRDLMNAFLANTPNEEFSRPSGVVEATICKSRGLLIPKGWSSGEAVKEYFAEGTEPTEPCYTARPTQPPQPTESPTPTPDAAVPTDIPVPTEVPPTEIPTPSFEPAPTEPTVPPTLPRERPLPRNNFPPPFRDDLTS